MPAPQNPFRRSGAALAVAIALQASLAAAPAIAQTASPSYRYTATEPAWAVPAISGFDVQQVQRLDPGTVLRFTLWGTPGLQARLAVDGAAQPVILQETSSGVYQGWYTIALGDRIDAASRVTANLRDGNRVATRLLDESLLATATPPVVAGSPRIDEFKVGYLGNPGAERTLLFTLRGTPRSQASLRIRGARDGRIFLNETATPGVYEGRYVVKAGDRLSADKPIVARLRNDNRTVTAELNPPLDVRLLPATAVAPYCATCGVVTAIQPVEVRGDGNHIGAVAGAVLGGVVGNQVGGGDGRKAATIAGVIGGALLGREYDRRQSGSDTDYEVTIRMDSGLDRTITVDEAGALRVGSRVRVDDSNQIAIDERTAAR